MWKHSLFLPFPTLNFNFCRSKTFLDKGRDPDETPRHESRLKVKGRKEVRQQSYCRRRGETETWIMEGAAHTQPEMDSGESKWTWGVIIQRCHITTSGEWKNKTTNNLDLVFCIFLIEAQAVWAVEREFNVWSSFPSSPRRLRWRKGGSQLREGGGRGGPWSWLMLGNNNNFYHPIALNPHNNWPTLSQYWFQLLNPEYFTNQRNDNAIID